MNYVDSVATKCSVSLRVPSTSYPAALHTTTFRDVLQVRACRACEVARGTVLVGPLQSSGCNSLFPITGQAGSRDSSVERCGQASHFRCLEICMSTLLNGCTYWAIT